MGIIGKDFKYKVIKDFLTKNEINYFSLYCEIRHRTNFTEFDFNQNNIGDTRFYSDPLMETLMLMKKSIVEKETGKKLLATYSYWRTYTKFAILEKHIDRPACEISVTVLIGKDKTKWPLFFGGNPVYLERGDAIIYLGCEVEHWREEFQGDHQFQAFLHYVDADGKNKEWYMDKRKFWGIKK
jgi:hypothetical protein